ncbi:MAG: hypothetical protein JOS17DRAFT_762563 [Linnemannia elongata]|nr:MAG: hypothetical protein JOS17DRAFT_762563 [Linnemannia elongata]
MKRIHLVLHKDLVKFCSLKLKKRSDLPELSFKMVSLGETNGGILAETFKTTLALTTLDLRDNAIRVKGVMALSEALKTNSTLTTLELEYNSIGVNGVATLS